MVRNVSALPTSRESDILGLYWSLSSILYGGTLVLGPAQAVPSGHLVNTIMEEISIKTLVAPPSILEDVVKGYGNDFETNAKTLQHVFYGGGKFSQLWQRSRLSGAKYYRSARASHW